LQSVNQLFCENTVDSAYATLFFAQYDDQARRLRYANCGHYSGILLRAGTTLEELRSTGTVLGLFRDWDCSIEEQQFLPGDILALYTDGVIEAFDSSGEEYGETRLIEALRRGRDLPSQSLLAEIVNDVQRFSGPEQYDDITLMIAKCK
jgi:serine phosphatase RsbU (regulator of sigma subunit)